LSLRGKQLLLAASAVALLLGGCAHTGGQRSAWGHGADFTPGWAAIGRAAREAATNPYTWIPLAGAAALQIGDADDEIADWARREHPLFGSTTTAKDASDWLRLATLGSYAGIGLGAPGCDGQWWADKRAGFTVGAGTLLATKGITSVLKTTTGRTRPNGRNNDSFPSGHSGFSAASARLASDALDSYDLTAGQRFAADAGLFSLVTATGWARVEAGEHRPSEVLVGAALGNFLAVFSTHAFLHPVFAGDARLQVETLPGGAVLVFSASF
jgi:membrane-associated phospholipid phosphatase